ncbi:MAG: Tm-1-like ATP-binding domain-containing protein [Salinibacterium sp.]|nr:Tm-1-like ATP-binding domain-containing protein [Salinibacterium sp.]
MWSSKQASTWSGARVILAGALDTKAEEYGFVRDRLERADVPCALLDFGVLGSPGVRAEIDREAVARAGGSTIGDLVASSNRNDAMVTMARGAAAEIRRLHRLGLVSAVVVLGGSNAGYVMATICEELPIGYPKLLVSTIVAGDTRPYVRASDLTMMYPVVDIAGLNSISRPVLAHAADACAGMVKGASATVKSDVLSVAASMFGVTTACVTEVQMKLSERGHETHVFHANGTGGRTLEAMIRSGLFSAVADLTTTELADELLGGVCSAGSSRLEAATASGTPQVVSVGALDMVNFGAPDTVPSALDSRLFFSHNPAVTLMRTNAEECEELGAIIARKLNPSSSFTEVLVPAAGFSQISVAGAPFHDPVADAALIASLTRHLDDHIPLRVLDVHINDPRFAAEVVRTLGRALSKTEG